MSTENQVILQELQEIKCELHYIKDHMMYVDVLLTKEEEVFLQRAREEYKQEKTISLEKLEEELDQNV